MDGRMDTDGWTDGRMDRRTDGQTERRMDGWLAGWLAGWLNGRTNRMDRRSLQAVKPKKACMDDECRTMGHPLLLSLLVCIRELPDQISNSVL